MAPRAAAFRQDERVRTAWAAAIIVALAGCTAPAVSLPEPDPSRAPTTFPTTTSTTIAVPAPPETTVVPTAPTAPTDTTDTASDATTAPEPPPQPLPVDEIVAGLLVLTSKRAGGVMLDSVYVTREGVWMLTSEGSAYRWDGDRLDGPAASNQPPNSGTVSFAVDDVNAGGAMRAEEFVRTYIGGVTPTIVQGVRTPADFLWIVQATRPDGSNVSAVFDGAGDLRALQG
jgi:type IV secretory pathway VirB10-like protein